MMFSSHNIYEGDDIIKKYFFLIILVLFLPYNINAYSKFIYASGKSIGIELKSDYILVVGCYKKNEGCNLKIGDKIIAIDDKKVENIKELTEAIQGKKKVSATIIRDNKTMKENIKIDYKDGIYKTGLYVKDSIMGIGTLTYIDPNSNIFGSLGHEIAEKITKQTFETNDGTIFSSNIHKIIKSKPGFPGEKIAKFNFDDVKGNVFKNSKTGIFGIYTSEIEENTLYEVGSKKDINLGKAQILTSINKNNVESFDIEIIKTLDKNNHDILFEITDARLLKMANGIVQGMSGSPIIQNNKIIGAVTHVVIDNPIRGYGISIEKMLIDGEN